MTAASRRIRVVTRCARAPRAISLGLRLTTLVLTSVLAACGGGGSGGHGPGADGSTSSVGSGVPTPGSAVTGMVPVQANARLTFLAGSEAGPGYRDGPAADALFYGIGSIAVDSAGNRYAVDLDNQVIRKIDTSGNVSTYAGTVGVAGDVDGPAASAEFQEMVGLAVDNSGNLLVTESTDVVREITTSGQVITIAGLSGQAGSVDANGINARFNSPGAIATDGNGNIYVADSAGLTIRRISSLGDVTTIFGSAGMSASGDNNPALATSIESLAFDGSGNLFFVDNFALREITQGGAVTTLSSNIQPSGPNNVSICGLPALAWNGTGFVASANCSVFLLSATGTVTSVLYALPPYGYASGYSRLGSSIAAAPDGSVDVPINSFAGDVIEQFSPGGTMSLFAGIQPHFGDVDATGTAASFGVVSANGATVTDSAIAADAAGNLYIADTGNNTIRKVTPAGVVTTLAGQTQLDGNGNLVGGYADGQGSAARFNSPTGIAVNAAGTIYVADTGNQVIRQITAQGLVTTLAGAPSANYSGGRSDGNGASARFSSPGPLTIDKAGNLYVGDNSYIVLEGHADETSLNGTTIRKITAAGVVTTVAGNASTAQFANGSYGTAEFTMIQAIALDPAGNIFVLDSGLLREITDGVVKTAYSSFKVSPIGLAIDAGGNFYLASSNPNEITKIDTQGNATIFAGSAISGLRPGVLPGGLNGTSALTVDGNGLAVMMIGGVATIQ